MAVPPATTTEKPDLPHGSPVAAPGYTPPWWSFGYQLPWLVLILVVGLTVVVDNFKILLLLTGSLAFVMSLIFARDWIILALFSLVAFSVEVDISGTTSVTLPTEALIPALIFAVAVSCLIKGRFRYISSPLNLIIFAYFAFAGVSILWSEEPISTVKAIIRESGYVLAGFYLFQVYAVTRRRLIIFLVTTMVVHFLLTMYGFATQAAGGIRIYDDIAYPFFENHCIYAAYLVVTLCFLIAFASVGTRGIWTLITGALALLIGLAVAMTFVRAAWIAMAVVLFYFAIRLRRSAASVDLLIVMLVLVSSALLVATVTDLGEMLIQRLRTVTDTGYVANYDRIDRWLAAYHMWQDNPLLGVGYGAYPDVYEKYIVFEEAYSTEIRMGAHNLYLEIMAELGLVGITIFVVLLGVFRYQANWIRERTQDPVIKACVLGAKAAMLSILVHSFFNNLGPSDKISMTLWLLFAVLLVCKRLVGMEKPERQPELGVPA